MHKHAAQRQGPGPQVLGVHISVEIIESNEASGVQGACGVHYSKTKTPAESKLLFDYYRRILMCLYMHACMYVCMYHVYACAEKQIWF
jgi:hypothetical protein